MCYSNAHEQKNNINQQPTNSFPLAVNGRRFRMEPVQSGGIGKSKIPYERSESERGTQGGEVLLVRKHIPAPLHSAIGKQEIESILEPARKKRKTNILKLASYEKYSFIKDSLKNEYQMHKGLTDEG